MSQIRLPDNLVQYVTRDLLRRAEIIQLVPDAVREIAPALLPQHELQAAYPDAALQQWLLTTEAKPAEKKSILQKLNPFASNQTVLYVMAEIFSAQNQQANPAKLVLASFALDVLSAGQSMEWLEHMPAWFAADGVLLFATLGAGALPELINQDEQWLTHVSHLPSIMNMGRRLQDLRFGLPVLDVETVRLGYEAPEVMWQDVLGISPSLQNLTESEQNHWRERLYQTFENGLRQLSLEVMYGQVWQPTAEPIASGVQTISLESLTASLKNRSTHEGDAG